MTGDGGNKRKILIVDDEYAFAEFAQIVLQSEGYEAVVCLDGGKAAAAAASEKPDLILLDVHMRDVTGPEVIRRLRDDPSTRRIPIVLCSLTRDRMGQHEVARHGAVDFLRKPLKKDELKMKIRKALEAAV